MKNNLRANPSKFEETPAGFYAFHTTPDQPYQYRLHLRILPNKTGILIVNAASILRLNETGTYFAWVMMQGGTEEEILKRIQQRYKKADSQLIKADYRNFFSEILNIIRNPDQAPVVNSTGFQDTDSPETQNIPARANLCLTYQNAESEYSEDADELSTEEWKRIIRQTFDAGIPQVLFFGGEPTLRPDFIDLLTYAEDLGLVSGLVTSAERLITDKTYVEELINTGLDHLVLEVDPAKTLPADLAHIFDQDLFTCLRFAVDDKTNLLEWAQSMARRGANAFSPYPADIESSQAAANLLQQLLFAELNIEQDLPFPRETGKPNPIRLFSPEVDGFNPDATLTYLPDGSLAQDEA